MAKNKKRTRGLDSLPTFRPPSQDEMIQSAAKDLMRAAMQPHLDKAARPLAKIARQAAGHVLRDVSGRGRRKRLGEE